MPVRRARLWGLFISPKARYPLNRGPWLVVQVVLFGAAVVGLVLAERVVLGLVFGAVTAINLALVADTAYAST